VKDSQPSHGYASQFTRLASEEGADYT